MAVSEGCGRTLVTVSLWNSDAPCYPGAGIPDRSAPSNTAMCSGEAPEAPTPSQPDFACMTPRQGFLQYTHHKTELISVNGWQPWSQAFSTVV